MVRAPDAPVETAKYMGHGVCDNVTKTVTLHDYTDDHSTIKRTVFLMKNAMNVTPSELRGIGIHINKLDGGDDNGAVAARPINNALKMMFDKVAEKNKDKNSIAEPVTDISKRESTTRSSRGRKCSAERGRTGKSTTILAQNAPTTNQLVENNHGEELDMSVLAELPEEIRAEVLRDYTAKRRRLFQNPTKSITQLKPKSNIVDEEFLAALPADIRSEVLRDQNMHNLESRQKFIDGEGKDQSVEDKTAFNATDIMVASSRNTKEDSGAAAAIPSVSEDNIFIQTHWRETLQQWLDTTSDPDEPPLQCDVNTVVECAVELVRSRRLNTLYLAMRFLHRFVVY